MKKKIINPLNFSYNNHNLRTEIIKTEPYFCLKDVCDILEIGNPSRVIERLDSKGVTQINLLSNGGKQKANFINEPNLYRVIFRSDKPEAKSFQDWVFDEVLPSIRKNGRYKFVEGSPVKEVRQIGNYIGDECEVEYRGDFYFVRSRKQNYYWIDPLAVLRFRPVKQINFTGLYLIKDESGYKMRHLYQNGDKIRIVGSSNGSFPTIEVDNVNIVGAVDK